MTTASPQRDLGDLLDIASIHSAAKDPDTGHLVIGLNKVISSNDVRGLDIDVEEADEGVNLKIVVEEGVAIARPVHMCFGLLQEAGVQKINIDLDVKPRARIDVIAHCIFPNAETQSDGQAGVQHLMDAKLRIGPESHWSYFERHVHSNKGGLLVVPKSVVELDEGAHFTTDFELLHGRVGVMDIDYEATCAARSVLEMNAKVSGRGDDKIKIREVGHLVGDHARGVLLSRVAVRDRAQAEVYNKMVATAPHARGHVDCKEIIQGDATASAIPIVEVSDSKAHVTHEAALGSVDSKQLQTLMARGLSEDDATDVIIDGLLGA